jgi:hypothetical protein
MVGVIPLNLRSQETNKGVPHARAPPPPAGPSTGSGSTWQAGRRAGGEQAWWASGRGVIVLIFSTHYPQEFQLRIKPFSCSSLEQPHARPFSFSFSSAKG